MGICAALQLNEKLLNMKNNTFGLKTKIPPILNGTSCFKGSFKHPLYFLLALGAFRQVGRKTTDISDILDFTPYFFTYFLNIFQNKKLLN
jgi:hypothetical protein